MSDAEATTATETDPTLADYLRERDVMCPSCGALLRGTAASRCEKCGVALTVPILEAAPGGGVSPAIMVVRVLAAVAFCVAMYLAFNGIFNKQPAGCSGDEAGCGKVLNSEWSRLWGVPVSVPGLAVYAGIFAATLFVKPSIPDRKRRDAWMVLLVLGLFAGLAGLWFIYLQLAVIKEICPYCMVDHACGLVIAAILLSQVPIATGEKLGEGARSSVVLGRPLATPIIAMTVAVMGLFILAQSTFKDDTHTVTHMPEFPRNGNVVDMSGDPVKKDGGTKDPNKDGDDDIPNVPTTPKERVIEEKTHIGLRLRNVENQATVVLRRDSRPVRGNKDGAFVFACLVDYTCPHCRAFHGLIDKAIERYGDQVGFMIMPLPLNADCNPYVPHTEERHKPACELATMALAVWKADATKFAAFDDWLFEPETPRTGAAARAKAEEVVGKEALEAALATGSAKEQIRQNGVIYNMAGQGRIPKVMFRGMLIEGAIVEDRKFWDLLENIEKVGLEVKKK